MFSDVIAWLKSLGLNGVLISIAAYTLGIVTPILKRKLEIAAFGPPHFELETYRIRKNEALKIFAKKSIFRNRKIGIFFKGRYFSDLGNPISVDNRLLWIINLSSSRFQNAFDGIENQDILLKFYHSTSNLGNEIRIEVIEPDIDTTSKLEIKDVSITTPSELSMNINSYTNIGIACKEIFLDDLAQDSTSQIDWKIVHDGWEAIFTNLYYTSFHGFDFNKILVRSRYATVFTFDQCHDLSLQLLSLGHTPSGSCMGDVLRFDRTQNVVIELCKIFGSGVVGVVCRNCSNISLVNSDIFGCNQSAINLISNEHVYISHCNIFDNSVIDAISISGQNFDIVFESCNFRNNICDYYFFSCDEFNISGSSIAFRNCIFENNSFSFFSNLPDSLLEITDCRFDDQSQYLDRLTTYPDTASTPSSSYR